MLALLCLAVPTCMSGCPGGVAPDGGSGRLTVMAYNVNYGMPAAEGTVEVIRRTGADAVCLQETTREWERLLRRELRRQYPHMRFKHTAGAGGQATLSKLPFDEVYYRRPAGAWHAGWMIRVRTPSGPVQLLNVHLRPPVAPGADGVYRFSLKPHFPSRNIRRDQLAEMLGWADLSRATVILGDFNEPDNGKAISYACKEKGFASARARHDPRTPTWQIKWGPIPISRRLDHILYTPDLQCLNAWIVKDGGSDHRAVVATFERK